MGSEIVITVDGNDITNLVLYETASFESQMGAMPGTFEFTVKDRFQAVGFTTGTEVTLDVDGVRLYGGYVTQVAEKFAFPVDLTADPEEVQTRQWVLRGVDYNILFDRRVLRNTGDYTHHLGTYPAGSAIGDLIRDPLCSTFLDIPNGFDTDSLVDAGVTGNPDERGAWMEQGTAWRKQMEDFARWGVVYYITAAKELYVREVEDSLARWTFSDKPNRLAIPIDYEYLPTIGFREGEFTEDGTLIINDALVWGGSEWSNGVVFARRQNEASITARGRWQTAETYFGQLKTQARVNARANVIVDGTVSGTSGALTRGYVNPQRMAKVVWFAHLVPTDPNNGDLRSHLRPGDITSFILYTLGEDAAHPLIMDLPLRSITITFPGLDPDGLGWVRFEGTFGLQLSDPWWLWKYLRDREPTVPTALVSTTTDPEEPSPYGGAGSFSLSPTPDGSNKVFNLPGGLAYINGTSEVYVNGLRYFAPANYTESDPEAGEITFSVAPAVIDILYVIVRLVGSSGGGGGSVVGSVATLGPGDSAGAMESAMGNMSVDIIELTDGLYTWKSLDVPDRTTRPLTIRPAAGATVTFTPPEEPDIGGVWGIWNFAYGGSGVRGFITIDGLGYGRMVYDGFRVGKVGVFNPWGTNHVTLRNQTFRNLTHSSDYEFPPGTTNFVQPYHAWCIYAKNTNSNLLIEDWWCEAPSVNRGMSAFQIETGTFTNITIQRIHTLDSYYYAGFVNGNVSNLVYDDWTMTNCGSGSRSIWLAGSNSISGSYSNIVATSSDSLDDAHTGGGTFANGGGNSGI